MLLRVRGKGASPENSQATLVYLRGFRHTNTRPPPGVFTLDGIPTPLLYPHFHVGIQSPFSSRDEELKGKQVHWATWKELWNMYDIVYDGLRLFPDSDVTTALLSFSSSSSCGEAAGDIAGFAPLTTRRGAQMAVVITHYFAEDEAQAAAVAADDMYTSGGMVVLDVSNIPLKDAATRIGVELAWVAGYASMHGALNHASYVIVRLPYKSEIAAIDKCSAVVREGLNFLGEHIALLAKSFKKNKVGGNDGGDVTSSSVDICFIGASDVQLRETLARLCRPSQQQRQQQEQMQTHGESHQNILIFAGDQHEEEQHHSQHRQQELHTIASSLGVSVSLVTVPLKKLLDAAEEEWDSATTRENQVLNFCPCCGCCGDH